MSISPVSNLQAAALIVDPTPGNGNYTDIALAIAAAVSGQTILIKPGTYTFNGNLKAGVNLTALTGDDDTPTVTINAQMIFNTAGSVTISNVLIQPNSVAYAISVTGSVASVLTLNNCTINSNAASAIQYTSSSASSGFNMFFCNCNVQGNTSFFDASGAGNMYIYYCQFLNSGNSTVASTRSGGYLEMGYSWISSAIACSGTSNCAFEFVQFHCAAINTTCLSFSGTGGPNAMNYCALNSGNATCLTISSSVPVYFCDFFTTNATAIGGAGTIFLANETFDVSAGLSGTLTVTKRLERHGVSLSTTQPAFSAYKSVTANAATGNGAVATVLFDTKLYDQNTDFNTGTGQFTAPYAGTYCFTTTLNFSSTTSAMNEYAVSFVSTSGTYTNNLNYNAANGPASNSITLYQELQMAAGDTIEVQTVISGGASNAANIVGSASPFVTTFSGHLMF